MYIMSLGFKRNPSLWKIFEIGNKKTLAWSKWRCSSTCDRIDEALERIVSIRPGCWESWLKYWRQNCYMDNGKWWLLKVGSRGKWSRLIKDKYILIYHTCLCLYFCLELWIWLLFWLLLMLPAYIFEYLDTSKFLMRNDKWILLEDHG